MFSSLSCLLSFSTDSFSPSFFLLSFLNQISFFLCWFLAIAWLRIIRKGRRVISENWREITKRLVVVTESRSCWEVVTVSSIREEKKCVEDIQE